MAKQISYEIIADLRSIAYDELVSGEASRKGGPRLATPDLLHFLAEKAVIPILCAFARDGMYRVYRSIRSRTEADAAKKELQGDELLPLPKIPLETVIDDVITEMMSEGVPEEIARRIATAAVERIRSIENGK